MVRTATCCCKRTTIELDGDPVLNAVCHCDDCKRRSGSAFGWSAYFEDAQVIRSSAGLSRYDVDTSPPQHRFFCSNCGSTVFWKSPAFPGWTGVAAGCFAGDLLPPPAASYRETGRCTWIDFPASVERHAGP